MFDSWTNSTYWGFYSATLHFAMVDRTLHETMLGFFVEPSPGAGERCACIIFDLLCSFQIADKLLATVTDNVSDSIKGANILANRLKQKFGEPILQKENRHWCVLHT